MFYLKGYFSSKAHQQCLQMLWSNGIFWNYTIYKHKSAIIWIPQRKKAVHEQPKSKDSEASSFTEGSSNKITSNDHNFKFQTAVLLLPRGGTTLAGKQRLRHSALLISIGLQWCEVIRNISSHKRYQSHSHCHSSRDSSPPLPAPVCFFQYSIFL